MAKAIVDRWFDAFRNRDVSQLEEELAEDFLHVSPFGEIKGKRVYIDLVRDNSDAFFDHTIEVVDLFECDDKIAVRYLLDGRPSCDCIYVRDGKIAEIHAYYHFGEAPRF